MPKKLRIIAIPHGEVKLNSTSEGLGAILHSALAWAEGCSLLQTLATPWQGSVPCGQRLGVGVGGGWGIFIIFSLKKLPPFQQHPTQWWITTAHPRTALMLWAVIQTILKRGGGPVPHSQAGGVWMSGSWGDIRCWICRAQWAGAGAGPSKGAGAPSLPKGFGWGKSDLQWAERGQGGAKLSLHALSRRGSRATGCQCSLRERRASRKKRLSPLKSTQEDLFPRISYLGNLHPGSKAECLLGNKKMRCDPKSVLACRLCSRKFEEAPEAAAGSQNQRQSWVGWRPSWCLLPVPCPPALAVQL